MGKKNGRGDKCCLLRDYGFALDGMKLARVFPTKTSMSPTDEDVFFGEPPLFKVDYDEVHISVTFTWDIPKANKLAAAWRNVCDNVKVGGPAIGSYAGEFVPGLYLRRGITITSRGCPHNCAFCFVPKREGGLRELEIRPGNVIQDNNILACSPQHLDKVFKMLDGQRAIEFKGGLEARRITPEIARRLSQLRIKSLWLACDARQAIPGLRRAVSVLQSAGFNRNKLYVYVLCGKDMVEEEDRLRQVYEAGALPFAQLYRDKEGGIEYGLEWRQFARRWSRPAATKAYMKQVYCRESAERWSK